MHIYFTLLKKEKSLACVLIVLLIKPGLTNDTCVSDRLYNSIYTLTIKKLISVKELVEV